MRIFISGATGLIGSRLIERLLDRGDDVVALTRDLDRGRHLVRSSARLVQGDARASGPWLDEVAASDVVVNLAGEPIFGHRWSDAQKKSLTESRLLVTRNLVAAMGRPGAKTSALVSGSAIGYYWTDPTQTFDEKSPAGSDFLARLSGEWEREASAAQQRVALIRTGIVLSARGGALAKMLPPFRAFVGGPIGSGAQWTSWIHLEDEVGLLLLAIDDARASGPINATAPAPCTNRELSTALGRALGRPAWMPVPAFALRAAFGESAAALLEGQRVLPTRALELGYRFRFATLDEALADLVGARTVPVAQPAR